MALRDNLISCYEFESGALETDAVVASGNTLTNTNGVTSVSGLVGNAASFVAASSMQLSHVDNAGLSVPATPFAVGVWAKFTAMPGFNLTQTIAAKFENTAGNNAWIFDVTDVSGSGNFEVRFLIRNNADSANLQAVKMIALSSGTWYWLWGQFDTSGGTIGVAVNNSALTTNASGDAGPPDDGAPIRMGTLFGIRYFDGLLDQFLLYKGGLPSSGERTQLYNAGAGLSYAAMAPASSVIPQIMNSYRQRRAA